MESAESNVTPAIISRTEAISLGLKRYFTGKPCINGHVTERTIGQYQCVACNRESVKKQYVSNPRVKQRRPEIDRAYRQRNKEKISAQKKARYQKNIDAYSGYKAKRRAKCEDMTEFDRFVVMEAYAACARRKVISGYDWHVDHMIPLAKGGNHEWSNIQAIPASLNRFKHDRMMYTKPMEWINAL